MFLPTLSTITSHKNSGIENEFSFRSYTVVQKCFGEKCTYGEWQWDIF